MFFTQYLECYRWNFIQGEIGKIFIPNHKAKLEPPNYIKYKHFIIYNSASFMLNIYK